MKEKDKFMGESAYRGRKGIEPCGAKGIYLVNVLERKNNDVKIVNILERSRLQKAKDLGIRPAFIESDLVYPMVGGRNIRKWGISSYLYILLPHYNSGKGIYRGIPESELKVNYPKTFNWLYYFKDLLLETRIRSGKFFDEKTSPFYRLDNVGEYTFKNYHVVWREQHKNMTACVISSINDVYLGKKVVVVDSKVLGCALETNEEAHYLCAIINSPIITKLIEAYTIDTQRGVDILKNIRIPQFDTANKIHIKLSELSLEAHAAVEKGINVLSIECEIDKFVQELFNNL
jgi:hypothetical protein